MKIKFKDCDGEIEEVEVNKIEINASITGGVEMKVITEDDGCFLLFGSRLDNVVITDN